MKRTSPSYIFTAHVESAADMAQIAIVKRTVSASNKMAKNKFKWETTRALYKGVQLPEKPTLFRVRLMPRGPRRAAALKDGLRRTAYDQSLPARHATHFDVYVHEIR